MGGGEARIVCGWPSSSSSPPSWSRPRLVRLRTSSGGNDSVDVAVPRPRKWSRHGLRGSCQCTPTGGEALLAEGAAGGPVATTRGLALPSNRDKASRTGASSSLLLDSLSTMLSLRLGNTGSPVTMCSRGCTLSCCWSLSSVSRASVVAADEPAKGICACSEHIPFVSVNGGQEYDVTVAVGNARRDRAAACRRACRH